MKHSSDSSTVQGGGKRRSGIGVTFGWPGCSPSRGNAPAAGSADVHHQELICVNPFGDPERDAAYMPLFLYRCPTTGYHVQGFASEDVVEDHHVYEPVTCLACRQIHHVNPTTGTVLGETAKLSAAKKEPRP
jgi:hypothetical protein